MKRFLRFSICAFALHQLGYLPRRRDATGAQPAQASTCHWGGAGVTRQHRLPPPSCLTGGTWRTNPATTLGDSSGRPRLTINDVLRFIALYRQHLTDPPGARDDHAAVRTNLPTDNGGEASGLPARKTRAPHRPLNGG